jgi:hypothetical protein
LLLILTVNLAKAEISMKLPECCADLNFFHQIN